jgi:hypothetical protein
VIVVSVCSLRDRRDVNISAACLFAYYRLTLHKIQFEGGVDLFHLVLRAVLCKLSHIQRLLDATSAATFRHRRRNMEIAFDLLFTKGFIGLLATPREYFGELNDVRSSEKFVSPMRSKVSYLRELESQFVMFTEYSCCDCALFGCDRQINIVSTYRKLTE